MATLKDKLVVASERVWNAYKALGSLAINIGDKEGEELEDAIIELRATYRKTKLKTSAERAALVNIINALNQFPEPIHYKVREAIEAGRRACDESDLIVED